jgi:hypothetical protein
MLEDVGVAAPCAPPDLFTLSPCEVFMQKRIVIAILLLFVLTISAGCGAKATEVVQPPTPTLHPTFTPTAAKEMGAPPPTPAPTQPNQHKVP